MDDRLVVDDAFDGFWMKSLRSLPVQRPDNAGVLFIF